MGEELVCLRCEHEGEPIVVGQSVKCFKCRVNFNWVVAGKYLSALRARKDEIRRKENNKKTTRSYRLK